jgi:hypothetical protein
MARELSTGATIWQIGRVCRCRDGTAQTQRRRRGASSAHARRNKTMTVQRLILPGAEQECWEFAAVLHDGHHRRRARGDLVRLTSNNATMSWNTRVTAAWEERRTHHGRDFELWPARRKRDAAKEERQRAAMAEQRNARAARSRDWPPAECRRRAGSSGRGPRTQGLDDGRWP